MQAMNTCRQIQTIEHSLLQKQEKEIQHTGRSRSRPCGLNLALSNSRWYQSDYTDSIDAMETVDRKKWVNDGSTTGSHQGQKSLLPALVGGRGGFRTPDRWCVKPELYH